MWNKNKRKSLHTSRWQKQTYLLLGKQPIFKHDSISHATGCYTLKYCDYEDIESAQTVGLHCGWAGKAEESGVWGGTACTDAVAFKGRMRNSEMQIGLILIALVSLLETRFKSTKRKKQLRPLGCSILFVRLCRFSWESPTFSQFHTFKQQYFSSIVIILHIATCFSHCQMNTWFTWQHKTLTVFPAQAESS